MPLKIPIEKSKLWEVRKPQEIPKEILMEINAIG